MTADEFRAELEEQLGWRKEELVFFKNRLNDISDVEKDKYRKSLVLILYSHMEGCVKIWLQTYIHYINSQNLKRKSVNTGLKVASMHQVFLAYENIDRKCNFFKSKLPEDKNLHRLYRRIDFMEQLDEFIEQPLRIEDSIVDTESNLRYIILQKNLYKLGLPIEMLKENQNHIDALVNRRNSIAHGDFSAGVTEKEFSKWEEKVNIILSELKRCLYDYVKNQRYLAENDI